MESSLLVNGCYYTSRVDETEMGGVPRLLVARRMEQGSVKGERELFTLLGFALILGMTVRAGFMIVVFALIASICGIFK